MEPVDMVGNTHLIVAIPAIPVVSVSTTWVRTLMGIVFKYQYFLSFPCQLVAKDVRMILKGGCLWTFIRQQTRNHGIIRKNQDDFKEEDVKYQTTNLQFWQLLKKSDVGFKKTMFNIRQQTCSPGNSRKSDDDLKQTTNLQSWQGTICSETVRSPTWENIFINIAITNMNIFMFTTIKPS